MPTPPEKPTLAWSDLIFFTPVAYAMTAMWWIPEGDKYVPAIILILLCLFIASKRWKAITRKDRTLKQPLALAVTAAALVCGIGYVLKDGNISELRTLAALSVFSVISMGLTLTYRAWLTTIIASGVGFTAVCFYQFAVNDMPRAHLNYNPIPFATGLALVLISALFLAVTSSTPGVKLCSWTMTLLLFVALAMTGTRGVALPVTLLLGATITYLLYKNARSNRNAVIGAILIILITMTAGAFILQNRIDATLNEMILIESGDETGSIGLRLQFWKAALEMSTFEPLTGLGESHKSVFQDLARQGVVNEAAANYAPYHYHNQFLDTLVKRGIPGFLALLALLLTPAAIALRHFRKNKLVLGSILGITFMYTVASLTDVPFNHPVTINLFVLSMISLMSLQRDGFEMQTHSWNNPSVTT